MRQHLSSRVTAMVIGVTSLAGIAHSASAQFPSPAFETPDVYSSGGVRPISATIADLDEDGHNDIIIANTGSAFFGCPGGDCDDDGLAIFYNSNGDGAFGTPVVLPAGIRPYKTRVADHQHPARSAQCAR